jgi:prepilin-type N-terminal cleavage/methylation domain-containing protein
MTLRTFTRQRGYSLIEILVALAIFSALFLGALMIYDRSNRTFKQSVESSEMQQSTRVAFDKLVADVRLAGYDYDRDGIPMSSLSVTWAPKTAYTVGHLIQPDPPNGHTYLCTAGGVSSATQPVWPTDKNDTVAEGGGSTVKWRESGSVQYQQPDEQIEYAALRAITVRSNFDFETDAANENGREKDLQSSAYEVVTTDNDEIVTYALRSTTASANKDSITFYADTNRPRDVHAGSKKKENLVTIPEVDLSGENPPYTLVRFTLKADGTPDAGTPIADNIRDLRFTYYTDTTARTAIVEADLPYGKGQFDGAKADAVVAERDARADVKAVQVVLTGMNPQADYNYTDATDTVSPNYRKYQLNSLVVPRNLGRRGMREFNIDEPGKPTIQSICAGGCNAVYLTWLPPDSGGDVDSYSVLYDDDGCVGGFKYSEDAGKNLDGYIGRFLLEPGKKWYFAVQATNKHGAMTSDCDTNGVMIVNKTKPQPPTELHATGLSDPAYPVQENKIDLYWPAVTFNDPAFSTASCTAGGANNQTQMPALERRYYRVWRSSTDQNFQPGDPGSTMVLSEYTSKQPTVAGAGMTWTDSAPLNQTANCTDYYYRIQTVDFCARADNMNVSASKDLGESTFYPALDQKAITGRAEEKNKAPERPVLGLQKSDCNGGLCDVTLNWTPVSRDAGVTTGPPIYINQYKLYIYTKIAGTWQLTGTRQIFGTNTVELQKLILAAEYKFTLTAVDCLESLESDPIYFPCDFGTTTVDVTIPDSDLFGGSGSDIDPWIIQPPTTMEVNVSDGNASKIEAAVYEGGTQVGSIPAVSGTSASFALPETSAGIPALVRITVTDKAGKCSIYVDRYILDEPTPACALRDVNSDPAVVTFTSGSNTVVLTLKNTSDDILTLKRISVNWDVGKGETLSTFDFPGATGVSANCKLSTTAVNVPATATTVAANATAYKINVNYTLNGNKKLPSNPINSVCVTYETPTGDVKQCSIAPNAGTCTQAAGNCQ